MITNLNNAQHYKWGDNCNGWHFLKSETLSVIRESMPSGAFEKLHLHRNAQQVFYIISGVANFYLDNVEFELKADESIHVPKGIQHSIVNKGLESLEFLVISEPKAQVDRQYT